VTLTGKVNLLVLQLSPPKAKIKKRNTEQ